MKLTLEGSGYRISFSDRRDFYDNYGRNIFKRNCYVCHANANMEMLYWNPIGFFDNPPIARNSRQGIGQRGEVATGNTIGARVFSFSFDGVDERTHDSLNGYSPNSILALMLSEVYEEMLLTVETDSFTAKMYVVFGDNSSLENEGIELYSSRAEDGMFWEVEFESSGGGDNDKLNIPLYLYENNSTIPLALPKTFGDTYGYDATFNLVGNQLMNYEVGGSKFGTWDWVTLEQNDTHAWKITNKYNDNVIIIRSNGEIVNEKGINRDDCVQILKGDRKIIISDAGANHFHTEWNHNAFFAYPTDYYQKFDMKQLLPILPGGVNECR